MSEGVVIGLDLGTTSVKVLALDERGEVLARAGGGYGLHSGPDGAATQDAEEVVRVARTALEELYAQLPGVRFLALVPSAAMHSLVPVGPGDEVLAPAMTWADARPAATLPDLRARLDPAATYRRTGCPLQVPYHPARLWWLRQAHPELFARAARFVSLTDLLLHRLTGAWATSVGLASTTGLWNLQTADWDMDVLAVLGVDRAQLPAVFDAREVVGAVLAGPLAGTPVLAGSSDGALANLGTGARPGEVVVTVGTSGAVRRLGAAPVLDPQARTWSYRLDRATHLSGGAVNNGGLLLDWVRRSWSPELEAGTGFARLLSEAAGVPPGAAGLTLMPYLTGERSPLWRSDLSATLHGLRLEHGRAEVARAALEAVAFSLRAVWDVGLQGEVVYSTGGLARAPVWNGLLATVLGVPLRLRDAPDASAVGAALLGHDPAVLHPFRARSGETLVRPDPAQAPALAAARERWLDLYGRLYR